MSDKYIPQELRREVASRASHCCEYCLAQEHYSSDSFTMDHIVPQSLGGLTEAANLAFACSGCNQHKSARTTFPDPATGEAARLFNPRGVPCIRFSVIRGKVEGLSPHIDTHVHL